MDISRSGSQSETEEDDSNSGVSYSDARITALKCNDDLALRNAAERSRLPFDRPTEHELAFFPELWDSKAGVQVFLHIRNTALRLWLSNPIEELAICDLRSEILPPFNSDTRLIENIHHFLTRNGLINVGKFKRLTVIPNVATKNERKVIIIGAGISGISAALQLISFGFDVTIIDGRGRIGGRICSIKEDGDVMEIGGDTIYSSRTNALTVLCQQIPVMPVGNSDFIQLFERGKPVDEARDNLICGTYLGTRQALEAICHEKEQKGENGLYASRQRGYENMMNISERETNISYYNYWSSNAEICRKREYYYEKIKIYREIVLICEHALKNLNENDVTFRRCLKRDLDTALTNFEMACKEFEGYDKYIKDYRKQRVSKQFMHPFDYLIYNAYLALEEVVIGAPLEKVQLSCNAAKHRIDAPSVRLKEGMAELLEKLIEDKNMDIRLDHHVTNIDTSGDGVKLTVQKEDNVTEVFEAPYCVCTIPLGVLKKSIKNDEAGPSFTPQLPENKVKAIRNIGFGVVNKIVMTFDRAFWDSSERHCFAHVSQSLNGRGEMVYWRSVPGTKVMTAYLAGFSAELDVPDDVIISKAMVILNSLFPQSCPRMPLKVMITKYQDDKYALGTHSFMSLRTELSDFDNLIEPLKSKSGNDVVYFAGEHTSSQYHGTMEGGWLSGLRVAAQMANTVLGLNFVNFGDDVEIIKSDSDEDQILTMNGQH